MLFTDELGGGSAADVQPDRSARNRGADAIYDITDPANPRFLSYFKIPRTQTNSENCVAHNGNLIPNKKGRDILVQSWYQGGVSVIDWTKPQEDQGARLVRPRAVSDHGAAGSAGRVLVDRTTTTATSTAREIQRGFDVFELDRRRSRAPTSSTTAR